MLNYVIGGMIMPAQTQIVPIHQHPHTVTHVNDNTILVEEIVKPVFNGITTAVVSTADRGPSNQWVEVLSNEEKNELFGVTDYKYHGQASYNAEAFLNTPNTRVFFMRPVAEDATIANVIVVLKVKATPANDVAQTPGSLSVKLDTYQVGDLQDSQALITEMGSLYDGVADAEGYVTYPVAAFAARGAGQFGNDIRVRLSKDVLTDLDNAYTNLMLDVIEVQGSPLLKRQLTGSLFDGATQDGETIFLEDLVNEDEQDVLQKVNLFVASDALEDLYDLYLKTVKPADPIPMYSFDYLYGMQRNKEEKIPGYVVEPAGIDDFVLNSVEGIPLTGGDDGLLDPTNLAAYNTANPGAEKTRDEIIEELYRQAWAGEISDLILSRKRIPLAYLTDADYPQSSKLAMVALYDKRRDFQLYLDCGILNTVAEARLKLQELKTMPHLYPFLYEFQHYKIRDTYSGKKVPVTTMYFLNQELPPILLEDISRPLAGKFGEVSGHVKDSLLPVIDDDDEDLKALFYKNNVTYYTCIGENRYKRATQETSQPERSDLSEENNVRILFDFKKVIENLCNSENYTFTTQEDIEKLTASALEYRDTYYPDHVLGLEITFKQNAWEARRNITHGYAAVVFKGLNKRAIIEIDVNPRSV